VVTDLDAVTTLEAYLRAKRLPTAVDRITRPLCLRLADRVDPAFTVDALCTCLDDDLDMQRSTAAWNRRSPSAGTAK